MIPQNQNQNSNSDLHNMARFDFLLNDRHDCGSGISLISGKKYFRKSKFAYIQQTCSLATVKSLSTFKFFRENVCPQLCSKN